MSLSHQSFRASVKPAPGGDGAAARAAGPGAGAGTQSLVGERERTAREIELRIERFPSLPSVVLEIERVANDPGASVGDFEDAIRVDPVVTAKILRLANSAFYARARSVSTIRDAVGALGVRTLRSLVMAAASGGVMDRRLPAYGYEPDGLWKHSFAAALCCRAAASKMSSSERVQEEVFVAGLLHDIGKMVLDPLLEDVAAGSSGETSFRTPALEAERLGWSHARVGELIVAKWKLPPEIGEAIVHHHDPAAAPSCPLHVSVLVLANDFVKEAGIGLSASGARDIERARESARDGGDETGGRLPTSALHPAIATKLRQELSAEIPQVRALCEQLAGG